MAELHQKMGRYEKAETFNKRALSIRIKAFGTSHPDVGMEKSPLLILFSCKKTNIIP